jgi:hypothetical protein
MKRGIIALIMIILLSSFISADIMFTQQVKSVYNLGDVVNLPVKIKTLTDVTGSFNMDLICNGTAINFYKYSGINLAAGEEKDLDSSLVLVNKVIGDKTGICKVKAMLNGDYVLSNEFKISNSLNITGSLQKIEYKSGESIFISGTVKKENGNNLDGFIEAVITEDNSNTIIQQGTVTSGVYSLNLSLPDNLRAGRYLVRVKASEKNSDGAVTNFGEIDYNISIMQVPTNLELVLKSKEIIPGTNASIKIILHDQTGDSINSTGFITIKDSNNKIIEQKEVQTGEFFEYSIKNNEPPSEFSVFGVSNQLTANDKFNVEAKEDVSVEIVNKTILITNTGNILYNKTLFVKVGDNPLNIPVLLNVGESKKYTLSAPDGEYNVEVTSDGGKNIQGVMSLTGGVIDIKEISGSSLGISLWILLILILGIVIFLFFRKIYKKPFFEKKNMNLSFKKKDKDIPVLKESGITRVVNKAEISLSIKEGEKQEASVICLRIKNLKDIKSRKGSATEAIDKIISLAEENKAVTYENMDYLFVILAPTKTRTFKNEKTALDMAEKINDILAEHNRMFNQKMDFGISLNQGSIVAKIENGIFKFMSMGTLVTASKKIASLAKEEVLLGEKMNDMLRLSIRTEKSVRNGVSVFSIKEIKRENLETKKFINSFLNRQGKE